jgi:acetyl-CoA C-acetyltransferase
MREVFIIDGLRTPIGALGKSLKDVSCVQLGASVMSALISKHNIDSSSVDEVIMGNVVSSGLGQNPARQALLKAGLLETTPGFTVNEVCGSGLKAVMLAAQSICCGDSDLVIAGGMESASQCPTILADNKKPSQIKKTNLCDTLIKDGLWCNISNLHMGNLAENMAREFKITREEQDSYALNSHHKATYACAAGIFRQEIVPVKLNKEHTLSVDEKPRKGLTLKQLARLPAAFEPQGTVTAGNSSAPADGAALLLLCSSAALKKSGLVPQAKLLGYTSCAVKPQLSFTAANLAIERCLKATSLKLADIALFDIAEAFSVQVIVTLKLGKIEAQRTNVFGGDIALGHPLGACGARGLITLINALKVQKEKFGITSICFGGGGALALAVQMLN